MSGVLASMATGVSGLQAAGTNLGIISDNIANAGTTGFKSSRGEFQDVVATNLKGILGGNQIGRGSQLNAVTSIFKQGNLAPTERDSDLAIRGDGFFVLKDSSGVQSFTRDGSFRFDAQGRLTASDGAQVQGYKLDPVTLKPASDLTDVEFTPGPMPAKGTDKISIIANLDVRSPVNTFDIDLEKAETESDYSTSAQIFDSVGTAHNVTMYFYKSDTSEWSWYAAANGDELTDGEPNQLKTVASGKLTFTGEGRLATDELTSSDINFKGSDPNQKIDFFFGDAIVTRAGTGLKGTTTYGSNSQVYKQVQDGYAAGKLTNYSIDETGTVSGSYSNGVTRPLAMIALSRFENPEGLFKLGQNRFKEAPNSGAALIGSPADGGRGKVLAKTLERSNVDLAQEFVHMIQTQRNFQANAKTVSTSDELLQDIINLKR